MVWHTSKTTSLYGVVQKLSTKKNLEQVLARIEKSELKLNKTKCKFGLNEVKYVGHIFSSEGVRADPSKIEAIVDMPMPENASDVHRFLGMVTYLGKFLPNLSDKTACLRKLIEKDAAWDWTEEHTKQFRGIAKSGYKQSSSSIL